MPSGMDKFFWVLAVGGTTIFALKTITLLLTGHGAGDGADVGHGDLGHGGHGGPGHDGQTGHADSAQSAGHGSSWAFQFFTVQSLAVFAMGAGWMGLAAQEFFARSEAEALAAAVLFGVALAALLIKLLMKMRGLETSGTLNVRNAVGSTGVVYLTVPPEGAGQVEIVLQGRLVTWDAVSAAAPVPTGARVVVDSIDAAGRLVVLPL